MFYMTSRRSEAGRVLTAKANQVDSFSLFLGANSGCNYFVAPEGIETTKCDTFEDRKSKGRR